MEDERMIEEVRYRAGLADAGESAHVIDVVLSVLGERLDEHLSQVVAGRLPARFGRRLTGTQHSGDFDVEGLYDRVAAREGIREGFALEHTQVVCRAVAERLDDEAREHLEKELPEALAALFVEPEPVGAPPPHRHHGAQTQPRRGQTLSTGRPGGSHPVSEDHTGGAHRDSVSRSVDPHEDTKISSSKGTSQHRQHRTLSEGRGGSSRPVSESED